MKPKPLPSAEELNAALALNPKTGELKWRPRPCVCFKTESACRAWNKIYPGRAAGSFHKARQRRIVVIGNVKYAAHRLIVRMTTGIDPGPLDVDHANRRKADDRPDNLRLATRSQNMANRGATSSNRSGLKGVAWDDQRGCFIAQITKDGVNHYLGGFPTASEAHAAYAKAAAIVYGEFACARSPQ